MMLSPSSLFLLLLQLLTESDEGERSRAGGGDDRNIGGVGGGPVVE